MSATSIFGGVKSRLESAVARVVSAHQVGSTVRVGGTHALTQIAQTGAGGAAIPLGHGVAAIH
jgi:hypothetical protein